MRLRCLAVLAVCLATPAWAQGPDPDAFLTSGKFTEGIAALEAHLKQQPDDDRARFGQGILQLVQAIQDLGQKLTAYVPRTYGTKELDDVFGKIPAPAEPVTYARHREIAQEWLDDLARVDAILARIKSPDVKLSIHVGNVPLKFGGDGAQPVNLLPLLRESRLTAKGQEADFVITFDRADVDWLRGYCHVLAAMGEIFLAYDGQEFFDVFMHRLFEHVKTPYEFLIDAEDPEEAVDMNLFIDMFAALHVVRFPVVEPKRMTVALGHLESTVALSRTMWNHILKETDDDFEWIPGPRQQGVLGIGVTQEMIDKWMSALDETEKILQGKSLLPFWRGKPARGINLRKVFLQPGRLDLLLWVQGTAAAPYLEQGNVTSPEKWLEINSAFNGSFPEFAFWFN